jgi:brefeldin A-resistance guanine nucleotide exchange factor 1
MRTARYHDLKFSLDRSQTEWNLVFALLRGTLSQHEAARLSFEFITSLCRDGPDQIVRADNFAGLVALLDDFATTAGVVTESHQKQGSRNQSLTAAKCVRSVMLLLFC